MSLYRPHLHLQCHNLWPFESLWLYPQTKTHPNDCPLRSMNGQRFEIYCLRIVALSLSAWC